MVRILRLVCVVCVALLVMLFFVVSPALLQADSNSSVFVRVSNLQGTYILSFAPGQTVPNTLFDSSSTSTSNSRISPRSVSISPNGYWMFAQVYSNGRRPAVAYAGPGQPFVNLPINAQISSISAHSKDMFYLGIDSTGRNETFNFLNLATGQRVELIADPLPPAPQVNVNGANATSTSAPYRGVGFRLTNFATPVAGWTLKDRQLLFTAFQLYGGNAYGARSGFTPNNRLAPGAPNTVGYGPIQSGLYSIDLSAIDFRRSGSYPLPTRTQINTLGHPVGTAYLSPDGESLAYTYAVQDISDGNIQSGSLLNGSNIAVLNLSTRQTNTIATATTDTVLNHLTWAADSQTLIYSQNATASDTSEVYQYDLATQKNTHLPIAITSSNTSFQRSQGGLLVCDKTLYYASSSPGGDTLYSANLESPVLSTTLLSAENIQLLSCAPNYTSSPPAASTCDPFCTSASEVTSPDANASRYSGPSSNGYP